MLHQRGGQRVGQGGSGSIAKSLAHSLVQLLASLTRDAPEFTSGVPHLQPDACCIRVSSRTAVKLCDLIACFCPDWNSTI
jgi:hypothetical protein